MTKAMNGGIASVSNLDGIASWPSGRYCYHGCEFVIDINGKITIYANSKDLDSCVEVSRKCQDAELVIYDYHGYHDDNIDFLADCPWVSHVFIGGSTLDKKGLYRLPNLLGLTTDGYNSDLDLGAFEKLQFYSGDYSRHLHLPLSMPTLQALYLWDYGKEDLNDLPQMDDIKYLHLTKGKLKTLGGLDRFPQIQELQLAYCRNLTDVSAMRGRDLLWLGIDSCSRIDGLYDLLFSLPHLYGLSLRGNITLPSLAFVNDMPSLFYLWLLVKDVLDGDMSVCSKIQIVNFINKRHYHPKIEELPAMWPGYSSICSSGTTLKDICDYLGRESFMEYDAIVRKLNDFRSSGQCGLEQG